VTRVLAAVFTALLALSAPALSETYPAHPDPYLNDHADLLNAQEEHELREWLYALRKSKGIEFTVLTIPSMKDYGHTGEIEPYATRLFNAWGVGHADRDDGVLMLIAKKDRQMRIELGSGYDASWNAKMKAVIDGQMLPFFRADDYPAGLRSGVGQVIFALTRAYPVGFAAGVVAVPKPKSDDGQNPWGVFGFVLIFAFLLFNRLAGGRRSPGRDSDFGGGGGSFGGGSSSGGGASGRW
jgi:uncharacterized protein